MAGVPVFIGLRYSLGGSGSQLMSFLSRLSMAGLVLGIAMLVTVLSVMNGFDREMRQRILALVPHISMQPWVNQHDWQQLRDSVLSHAEVRAAAPYLQGNALLVKGAAAEPVQFFGIDVVREREVSRLAEYADFSAFQGRQLVLGAALAERLGVARGESLSVAVPRPGGSGVSFYRFAVAALLSSGTELDQQLVLMPLTEAEQLLPGQAMSLRLAVNDVFSAPRVAWELSMVHGRDYRLRDWSQQFGNMYHAIQMSRKLVVIMLLAVVAVAVFNIVSTLVLVVNDKRADIAILRSQGATRGDVLGVFMIYGAVIGGVGAALGAGLGVVLSLGIGELVAGVERLFDLQLLRSDVYPISYLPTDVRAVDVLWVSAAAYAMSIAASLYPAWRASRIPPAETLRQH
ncbi:lipoprotein-releasing ABC transporter permease subunit [Spongiibacter sp.]|uniref:lipoprotein-releasing ABC transporter permease subunit n=1 Tax=Spongiibacter sp. TaxID=2024860 RepID=UPI003567007B